MDAFLFLSNSLLPGLPSLLVMEELRHLSLLLLGEACTFPEVWDLCAYETKVFPAPTKAQGASGFAAHTTSISQPYSPSNQKGRLMAVSEG